MRFREKLSKTTGIKEILLPNGYQMIGDIMILNLSSSVNAKKIAKAASKLVPCKTIMMKTDIITGEFRAPQLKKLWGKETITTHHEHECLFELDVTKVMWAKGNLNERKRIASLPKAGERILDMFAGLGYFTIPIGVHNPNVNITSIEKNPEAYKYLCQNIKLNKLTNVTPILGDSMIEAPKHKADRIMMGYIPEPHEFLASAFKALKDKGVIHYEGIRSAGKEESLFEPVNEEGIKQGYKCELLHTQLVKKYGPKNNHVVVDVLCYK
ncbi:MAG: class I SAM-dependent methyltransferase family protein [Candidatus Nanoarchaeia archaeon]|jgi:tRNA wybutosine-synthesizing protein 2